MVIITLTNNNIDWVQIHFLILFSSVLQHKKLAEGSAYEEVSTSTPYSENDISNSIKNGILYLEDPINHVSLCMFTNYMQKKWKVKM